MRVFTFSLFSALLFVGMVQGNGVVIAGSVLGLLLVGVTTVLQSVMNASSSTK
jgi:hypothetical protein